MDEESSDPGVSELLADMQANPPSSPQSPDKPSKHPLGLLPSEGPALGGDLTSLEMYPPFCLLLSPCLCALLSPYPSHHFVY